MPSPKPELPKRKRGKPEGYGFHPTTEQARMVELMTGLGIREDRMVKAIINPATDAPISPMTLRKHFRKELDQGLLKVDLQAGANLLTHTKSSAAAAIFFAKCRLGFKEHIDVSLPEAPNPEDKEAMNLHDLGRRMAFTLAMGGKTKTPA